MIAMMRVVWNSFFVAWAFMCGGCISLSVESNHEPVHTHLLNPEWSEAIAIHTAGVQNSSVLLVTIPEAQPGFETARMVYLRHPHEIDYYVTHQWVESPARMMTPMLVQSLERTGAWKSVVQSPTIVHGDYRLESEQLALEQRFFEQPNRVRVALRAQLIDLKQQRILGIKSLEVFEVGPSEDAQGGVAAANKAVGRMLDDLAMWATACVRHAEEC